MKLSTISSKGQITVPKRIRDMLNLNEGDQIAFILENGNIVVRKANVRIHIEDLEGLAIE
ncbi:AbrB/MazE/SpoVT family DNA-binding domain-containing protein [Paenibacillus cremeus]|uniref:AbrB/MazE/SpoVT family DNA-binding domain-containing protein n=1 Tax=Paenibacillus cremeus TaxID=2163881 RepID=A0A559K0J2_9BACL|nr:type II toxin-antitoxin system PrlF family antitoxin [Paenibacillus cremeus]TVY05570.1 AbrB/MazE/SpoVT family DNA-binding domain-containing protein [Paenibacillus cremeus]